MLRKRFEIYYIIGSKIAGWIEKIFRRKELADVKKSAQDRLKIIEEQAKTIGLLRTGDSMQLSQQERRLILLAIKFPAFWADVHPRPYKAYQRILRKDLIEKLNLSIIKEDDETWGADE